MSDMEKSNSNQTHSVSPRIFFSVVSTIFLSMFLVLMASGTDKDHWFRLFMTAYLIFMQILFVVASLRSPKAVDKNPK